jgi:hypothetical protein
MSQVPSSKKVPGSKPQARPRFGGSRSGLRSWSSFGTALELGA